MLQAAVKHPTREKAATARRVLYAEDSPAARIVTTALLEKLGYVVDAVEDGEAALARARAGSYDVILLDIEMPVMDGVTAARHIRQLPGACGHAPILALSAFLADSTEHTHWRDAFDCALPKPANRNELETALTRALDLRQQRGGPGEALLLPQGAADPMAVLAGLREALPQGSWSRLLATAGEEMRHAVMVMAACAEAGDRACLVRAAHSLEGLARSFVAEEVFALARAVQAEDTPLTPLRLSLLFAAIAVWQQG